ncbi:MAG: ferrochelatase [Lysobacterales bacterium]
MSGYLGMNAASGHRLQPKTAVVLVNLGTPDAPTPSALRRYLGEFLSDPRVVEAPRWLWWLVLHGVILRIRPARSARAYQSVWTPQGSPLLLGSQALTAGLARTLEAELGAHAPLVRLAMSYGQPALAEVLRELREQGMRRLLVLPLYPQYSGSTTASVFDAVTRELSRWRWWPELRLIGDYYRAPGYVAALAESVRRWWQTHGRADRLLLSFHGIPRRYLIEGDPYFCQCQVTARLLREALGLSEAELQVSFQSRVGREVWLQPYTQALLTEWGKAGVGRVQVLCPGFAIDCLETLEEIAVENAEAFRHAGGGALEYIPALNADAAHVQLMRDLVREHTQGWLDSPYPDEVQAREHRVASVRAGADWLGERE